MAESVESMMLLKCMAAPPGPEQTCHEVPGGRQDYAQQICRQVIETQVTDQDPQGACADEQSPQRHQVEAGETAQGELRAPERPAVIPVEVVDDRQLGRKERGAHPAQMPPLEEEERRQAVYQHARPSDHEKFAQPDQQEWSAVSEQLQAAWKRRNMEYVHPLLILSWFYQGSCPI